jgi:1,2-diacylglycerol 3-alpha-glucosyltransferase
MKSLGILWAQYGPYHFARVGALRQRAHPANVHALELADRTRDYQWHRPASGNGVLTICPGSVTEQLSFVKVFIQTRRQLSALAIEVCLLPGYSPKQPLAALLAAKSLGIRTVMMNDSHAGTARAKGLAAVCKRRLVRLFDAALVAGQPHRQYFAALGIPEEKIFTGYDAVDNGYFAGRAEQVRARAEEHRARYSLPAHYFLNVGRFVPKKNLETLIVAYRKFLKADTGRKTHLVLVGSGEEEQNLRALCRELRLSIHDHSVSSAPGAAPGTPGVHFHGFRQIEENPVFYALADAFILPSRREEWGLVVNEAMACGLPVAVSETAGCAADLPEPGWPAMAGTAEAEARWRIERISLTSRVRRNGFVFDPDSPDELCRIMLTLELLPALREAMARESLRIIKKFSCQNFADNALCAAQAALGGVRNENSKLDLESIAAASK